MTMSTTSVERLCHVVMSLKASGVFSRRLTLLSGLLCLLATGCASPTKTEPVRRSQPLLGTYIVVTACGADRARTQAAITAAFDEIRRIDSLMSLHRPDSELSRVNAAAAIKAVPISPDLSKVISSALAIAERTDGAFDPTIAPLTRLWGFL